MQEDTELKKMFDGEDRLVRMDEWTKKSGHARSSICRLVAEGLHPAPIKIGKRSIAWRASTLVAWINQRESSCRASAETMPPTSN